MGCEFNEQCAQKKPLKLRQWKQENPFLNKKKPIWGVGVEGEGSKNEDTHIQMIYH